MQNNAIRFCLAAALFATATAAQAAVHRVYPGESIQAALDAAAPGDTVLVEPGIYQNPNNGVDDKYGLRISTDNIRLIGKVNKGLGEAGKVVILYNDDGDNDDKTGQQTGIFAAPAGCEYDWNRQQCEDAIGEDFEDLKNFYIRGFTVRGFPKNGIQTRWVDGFEFVRNESADNLNNGIYPTLSANGLVRNNVSYGSLDTAMWIAGSENVRVIGNELRDSVIGFEITVSNNVEVIQNEIYGNTVGVGLFHPNGAGNPPLPVMANWVIEQNDIYGNNLSPNPAPPNSFQAALPPGAGVLLLGVSDHVVAKNNIEDNNYVGVGVLGWCTATFGTPNNCIARPPVTDPAARNNLIAQNYLSGNGSSLPPGAVLPPVDLLYAQLVEVITGSSGNCFEKNKPKGDFSSFSTEADGELPTDGC